MSPTRPEAALRLTPIDRPRSLLVRLFDWLIRRRLGKSMMPSRVIYARFPALLWCTLPLYYLLDRRLQLERELIHLIELRVSVLNGCSFCSDIHRASAMIEQTSIAKLDAAVSGEDFAAFSARERVALRYVTEIAVGGATDATFAALQSAFSEREIVQLTWLQAFTTYLNRMAVPLGIGSDGFCALRVKSG
ncbi:MAG: hypothetical protein JWN04_4225 [Myxococcaceae bacterium]|nr:hypothetical protein [Myxococcaceae bacterium]